MRARPRHWGHVGGSWTTSAWLTRSRLASTRLTTCTLPAYISTRLTASRHPSRSPRSAHRGPLLGSTRPHTLGICFRSTSSLMLGSTRPTRHQRSSSLVRLNTPGALGRAARRRLVASLAQRFTRCWPRRSHPTVLLLLFGVLGCLGDITGYGEWGRAPSSGVWGWACILGGERCCSTSMLGSNRRRVPCIALGGLGLVGCVGDGGVAGGDLGLVGDVALFSGMAVWVGAEAASLTRPLCGDRGSASRHGSSGGARASRS